MTGTHLHLDGYKVTRNIKGQDGYNMVKKLLTDIPDLIKMTKMMDEPYIVEVKEGNGEDGFSGFMLIKESHINIHTFSDQGIYWADVFSCKNFNVGAVVDYFKRVYGGKLYHSVILRGNSHF